MSLFDNNINNENNNNIYNNNLEENFIFVFHDGREIILTPNDILEISPSFYYKSINKNSNNIKIKIPTEINAEDLTSFVDVYKKGTITFNDNNINYLEENAKMTKFLLLSEFFENDSLSIALIKDYFLKGEKVNFENCLILLKISYKKLNDINNNNYNNIEDIDNIWFELFLKSLEITGENLLTYFKDKNSNFEDNQISFFEKKIIDEIFEKFAKNLINNNYIITEENSNLQSIKENNNNNNEINKINLSDLEYCINYLQSNRGKKNFFDLLTNEYMKICSEDNIKEINNLPNPTFLLKLNINDLETYYEEFSVDNELDIKNEKKIIIVVFYRKIDDSLNVCFKLENNNKNSYINQGFNIITFLSSVIIDELCIKQINTKSITNNKSMISIFKMNNFSKNLDERKNEFDYLTIKIFLKPCYVHSILCSYLINNFNNLYYDPKITKISKQFLILILRNKNLNYLVSADNIATAILNWLDDDINIREDISDIIESVNWEKVSFVFILEFIIKHSKIITDLDMQKIFINAFINKTVFFLNDENNQQQFKNFIEKITKELFSASNKLNYVKIFCDNKKLNKISNFETSSQIIKNFSNANTRLNTRLNSPKNYITKQSEILSPVLIKSNSLNTIQKNNVKNNVKEKEKPKEKEIILEDNFYNENFNKINSYSLYNENNNIFSSKITKKNTKENININNFNNIKPYLYKNQTNLNINNNNIPNSNQKKIIKNNFNKNNKSVNISHNKNFFSKDNLILDESQFFIKKKIEKNKNNNNTKNNKKDYKKNTHSKNGYQNLNISNNYNNNNLRENRNKSPIFSNQNSINDKINSYNSNVTNNNNNIFLTNYNSPINTNNQRNLSRIKDRKGKQMSLLTQFNNLRLTKKKKNIFEEKLKFGTESAFNNNTNNNLINNHNNNNHFNNINIKGKKIKKLNLLGLKNFKK